MTAKIYQESVNKFMDETDVEYRDNKSPIVVAMSGGVDSSVAAALMVERGHKVIGLTMQLYDNGAAVQTTKTCCAGQDIYDARRVATRLNIPHYVLDYENRFQQAVIDDFVDSYLTGTTPIPCIRCNQKIKFRDLIATARELNACALVTGHYVRRVMSEGQAELHKAFDTTRDQSYFLFTSTPTQLEYLRFPLGNLSKKDTRDLAAKYDLPVANKPDSQDICFVPDGDYVRTIERLRPGACESGNIVLEDGTIVGNHSGIFHFTVGQRRGLRVTSSKPLYVLRLFPEKNEVVIGPKESLAVTATTVNNVNWLDPSLTARDETKLTVKVRSTHPGTTAKVRPTIKNRAEIIFDEPPGAISPGQAAVFYRESRLVGGGWIEQKL